MISLEQATLGNAEGALININDLHHILSCLNRANHNHDVFKYNAEKKDPDTFYFPCEITREIGLSRNEISFLKKKGCRFVGRKTTINWVREFLAQKAEEQVRHRSSNLLR